MEICEKGSHPCGCMAWNRFIALNMYAHIWQIKLLKFSSFWKQTPQNTQKTKQNKIPTPPPKQNKKPSKNKTKTKQSKKTPNTKA